MKQYKLVTIYLVEVDNGFEVEIEASFKDSVKSANTGEISNEYVAMTEKEALQLISKHVPKMQPVSNSRGLPDSCQITGLKFNLPKSDARQS